MKRVRENDDNDDNNNINILLSRGGGGALRHGDYIIHTCSTADYMCMIIIRRYAIIVVLFFVPLAGIREAFILFSSV